MIRSIARKEILENIVGFRFTILTALLGLLMLISIIVSYGDYSSRVEDYSLLRPGKDSENLIIEPNPVSTFVQGLDANMGRLFQLSAIGIEVHNNQQSINRLFSLFLVPDMLFVIRVLLALSAILFTFDAISGEKENGTLKLVLANGGTRISLFMGKLLGRFALVFVPFLLFFLLGAFGVSVLQDVQAGAYYWEVVFAIIGATLLYVFVFASLGLWMSSVVPRSGTSLMIGLSAWALFVFVAPNLGTIVAETVAPVPPADKVELDNRLNMIQAFYERIQSEKGPATEGAGLKMIQQIWNGHREMLAMYEPKLHSQVQVARNFVRLSPSGSLLFLLTDVTNTGLYEEMRLKDAILQYVNRNFERFLGGRKNAVEPFAYTRAPLDEIVVNSAATDILDLLLFGLAFAGLAMASFLRYDPR